MLLITSGDIPARPRGRGTEVAFRQEKNKAIQAIFRQHLDRLADLEKRGWQTDPLGTQTDRSKGRVEFRTKCTRTE